MTMASLSEQLMSHNMNFKLSFMPIENETIVYPTCDQIHGDNTLLPVEKVFEWGSSIPAIGKLDGRWVT